jgi:hypothetical protein
VEHLLADEPIGAFREPLPARWRRWGRRHRSAVAALAAALLVLTAGGVAAWLWLDRQAGECRRGVASALETVAGLQQQARWAEARAVLDQARDRLGESGPADLRGELERARRNLELVARLDTLVRQLTRAGRAKDAMPEIDPLPVGTTKVHALTHLGEGTVTATRPPGKK